MHRKACVLCSGKYRLAVRGRNGMQEAIKFDYKRKIMSVPLASTRAKLLSPLRSSGNELLLGDSRRQSCSLPNKYRTCRSMSTNGSLSCSAQGTTSAAPSSTEWFQKTVSLPNHPRGCHVVTRQILKDLPELGQFEVGLASFFVQHTSCSLTINENASPDVPLDLNDYLDKVAPEGRHYRHLDEGMDDMPAHLKSSLMGVSLTIPIQHGRLALGTWQGIYLNEHRDYGGTRKVVVTVQGQRRADGRKYGSSIY